MIHRVTFKRVRTMRKGIGLSRATKTGGPVRKSDLRWYKDINGIWINSEKGCWYILFRRIPSYLKGYNE